MRVQIPEQEIKENYPKAYEQVMQAKDKKGLGDNGNWYYDYGMAIGRVGSKTPEEEMSWEEYHNKNKESLAGPIVIYEDGNKKAQSKPIMEPGDGQNLPPTLYQMFLDSYNKMVKRQQIDHKKMQNLDNALHNAGKEGSCRQLFEPSEPKGVQNGLDAITDMVQISQRKRQAVLPTLEDVANYVPDVVQQYKEKADGNYLVLYNPNHMLSDEWGFQVLYVSCVTERLNKQKDDIIKCLPRVITDEDDDTSNGAYCIKDDIAYDVLMLKGVDKMLEANQGETFVGWNKTKQYRYTSDEVYDLIGNTIFHQQLVMGPKPV